MAARLDLEARLRALREPRAPVQPAADPTEAYALFGPPPTVPVAVPAPPVAAPMPPPPAPAPAPPKRASFSRPRPNFAALSTPVTPPPPPADIAVSRPGTQLERLPSDRPVVSQLPAVEMAKILGPAYETAVAQAQFAIECERKRLIHTAIDGYIASGQALVALGRQQTVPHLQNILRTKALALLQRAEGLEEWATRVMAEIHAQDAAAAASGATVAARSKEETLRAAIAQSQDREERELREKEALVAQMKNQNSEMVKKLNQLVLLTKVRARFKRVISDRRARKAEEQRLRGESGEHEEQENDDDGEMDVDEVRRQSVAEEEYHEEDDAHRDVVKPAKRPGGVSLPTSLSSSPREEQKRTLLNELHQLIGLPEVDHLRKFKPLAETADTDRRREDLARELEEARLEAERLRAAVQGMEDTLRAAAEHSRERSIKLEKEKEEEVAQLQAELERMKSVLEMERKSSGKRNSVYLDSDDDEEDDDDDDRDVVAYEDSDIIDKLRVSLRGMSHEDTSGSPRERRSSSGRSTRVARTSEEHSSPRHGTQRMGSWGFDRDDEKREEGESDDGLWV